MNEDTPQESARLDQFIAAQTDGMSRAYAAKAIERGSVTVNDKVVVKPSYRLKPHDSVHLNKEIPAAPVTQIDLPVIYEDKDCVVINKPPGILTHSKGPFNPEATVATWLKPKLSGQSNSEREGIVHRLDRATSGVLICAKNTDSLSWLQKQFSQRKVKKEYIAIVGGHLSQKEAIVDMPIERNPRKPQTFRVGSNGKTAQTAYKVLEESPNRSLVELRPTTGRTHQLRVHLSQLGHPIVGDTLYDGSPAERLYLHAKSLEITLPGGKRKTFTADLPTEFKQALTA